MAYNNIGDGVLSRNPISGSDLTKLIHKGNQIQLQSGIKTINERYPGLKIEDYNKMESIANERGYTGDQKQKFMDETYARNIEGLKQKYKSSENHATLNQLKNSISNLTGDEKKQGMAYYNTLSLCQDLKDQLGLEQTTDCNAIISDIINNTKDGTRLFQNYINKGDKTLLKTLGLDENKADVLTNKTYSWFSTEEGKQAGKDIIGGLFDSATHMDISKFFADAPTEVAGWILKKFGYDEDKVNEFVNEKKELSDSYYDKIDNLIDKDKDSLSYKGSKFVGDTVQALAGGAALKGAIGGTQAGATAINALNNAGKTGKAVLGATEGLADMNIYTGLSEGRPATLGEDAVAAGLGAITPIVYPFVSNQISKVAGKISNNAGKKVAGEAVENVVNKVDDVANIAAPENVKVGDVIKTQEVPTPETTYQGGFWSNLFKGRQPKDIELSMKSLYDKAVKPSAMGIKTTAQQEKIWTNALDASQAIKANQANIVYTSPTGKTRQGGLPETIDEFAQAIAQTKKGIFNQYNDIAEKAGENAYVKVDKIIDTLKKLKGDRISTAYESNSFVDAIDKAIEVTKSFRDDPINIKQTQQLLQKLNKNLETFMKNPQFNEMGKDQVNLILKKGFDEAVDDALEESLGANGYRELKKAYSALKGVESDVNHRAIVYARQNPVSLNDTIINASTAEDLLEFITNPVSASIKKGVKEGLKKWTKNQNDTNVLIKKFFKEVGKYNPGK